MANTTKTAIVTGASQGIGAGLVEAFLKRLQRSRKLAKHYQSESIRSGRRSFVSDLRHIRLG